MPSKILSKYHGLFLLKNDSFFGNSRRGGKVPVTQETHMEVGEEIARAICSGKFKVTFFLSLGSVMGRSSLPRRSDGSNRRVTGLNGPSKVVGM